MNFVVTNFVVMNFVVTNLVVQKFFWNRSGAQKIPWAHPTVLKGSYFFMLDGNGNMLNTRWWLNYVQKDYPAPRSQTNTYPLIPLPIPLLSHRTLPLNPSYPTTYCTCLSLWRSMKCVALNTWRQPFLAARSQIWQQTKVILTGEGGSGVLVPKYCRLNSPEPRSSTKMVKFIH